MLQIVNQKYCNWEKSVFIFQSDNDTQWTTAILGWDIPLCCLNRQADGLCSTLWHVLDIQHTDDCLKVWLWFDGLSVMCLWTTRFWDVKLYVMLNYEHTFETFLNISTTAEIVALQYVVIGKISVYWKFLWASYSTFMD